MKAVVLERIGSPENLVVRDIPTPEVTPHHVLVGVRACGVGYRDIVDRRGGMSNMKIPIVLGHEFAGEVVAVGANVSRWRAGDRVVGLYAATCGACNQCVGGDERRCRNLAEPFGLTHDGGYAEFVLAHERALEELLPGIPYEVAATLWSATGVGYHNTVHAARVRVGDRVLVTGASGGVGSAAIQTAKLLGATTWAVTSREEKVSKLRALGADHVIVNGRGDFHKQVLDETDGRGVDAAIDCVGTATLNGTLRSLRTGGRVVLIGNLDLRRFELNLGYVIVRSISIIGSDNVTRAAFREVMRMVLEGRIEPVIHEVMPLERAADAHRLLEARGATGRVVLVP